MPATESTRALLLRSVDYGDADRVVTLFTERFGKTACIARGARRSRKRFGGALSPLAVLSVELQRGRGELATLTSAQLQTPFVRLLGDLARMNAAFSGLELLRALSPDHEPDAAVFAHACELFAQLDAGELPAEPLGLCFAWRLLALAGMAPRLDRCGLCGKAPRPEQAAELDVLQGHLVCRQCGGAPHRLHAALRARLSQALTVAWADAASADLPLSELASARRVLDAYIEARLGRPLHRPKDSP